MWLKRLRTHARKVPHPTVFHLIALFHFLYKLMTTWHCTSYVNHPILHSRTSHPSTWWTESKGAAVSPTFCTNSCVIPSPWMWVARIAIRIQQSWFDVNLGMMSRAAAAAHKCGREELPHIQGQGQRPRVPGCHGAETAKRSYPRPRSGAKAERSYPTSEVRAAAQRSNSRSKEQWLCRLLPRGATPPSRSRGAAVRRYPLSKVRSSSCALLEQLWRDTPCPR